MSIINLSAYDVEKRIQRDIERTDEIHREGFRRALKHMQDDCERMQDYCRRLLREGADVSEELKELEATGHGQVLVALLLKREASNG